MLTEAVQGRQASDGQVSLARLVLTAFRSYGRAELVVDPRPVVLVGPNGAGKTNVLEAISLLSPGRGLRGAALGELAQTGLDGAAPAPWAVAAGIAGPGGLTQVGTGLAPGDAGPGGPSRGDKRLVRINGAPASSPAALAEILGLSWLTPAMDRLFVEGASGRRRFLDRLTLVFDPSHAARAGAYERAMRERARLLREGRADPAWLEGLEQQMAALGVAIAAARAACLAELRLGLAEGESAFPRPELSLAGEVDAALAGGATALAVEDALAAALRAGRARDAESGRTGAGPHQSDLCAVHVATGRPAEQCSTGEQKALLIAIVLAAARARRRYAGTAPVLLLDEVAAHLDVMRRAALFDAIAELGTQAWMTGTDATLFAALGDRAQGFAVTAGRFVPVDLGAS